jgi:hypothetical protein
MTDDLSRIEQNISHTAQFLVTPLQRPSQGRLYSLQERCAQSTELEKKAILKIGGPLMEVAFLSFLESDIPKHIQLTLLKLMLNFRNSARLIA